jgi:hypothetical protein
MAGMSTPKAWIVRLPPGVTEPFQVYVNGVPQQQGTDFERRGKRLLFHRPLAKEGKLGFWRWFMGAWGIGTYRKDDQVDVAYELDGRPIVAHALDIEAPENDKS